MWLPAIDCSVRSATPLIDCKIFSAYVLYLCPYHNLNIIFQLLPARYQTKVVFCSWFLREYAAHALVRRLIRPSVTCNPDAPYQPRPCSLCVLCPATPLLLPRPLRSCTHRRTFKNSHWLYCSPAEQPDLRMLSIH